MQKKNQLSKVVQKKSKPHNVIKPTKKKIQVLKNEIAQYLDSNGYLSYSAKKKKYIILGTNSPKDGIAECPQCKIGQLMIIRSPITKKGSSDVQTITMDVRHPHPYYKKQDYVQQKQNVIFANGLL